MQAPKNAPKFDLSLPLVGQQREKALNLIFRWTHQDYKSEPGQLKRLLILRKEGTCSVLLSSLTDEEIARHLPYALKKQEEARAKRLGKLAGPLKGATTDSINDLLGVE